LVDGNVGMLLWSSMATCAREGLGTSIEDGVFTATCESVGVSWDATIVDGGSGWVRSNPSETKVDTWKLGGDYSSIGDGVGKTSSFVIVNC
jgi:hypothetical protein